MWPRDTNFTESRWQSKRSEVVPRSWEKAGMASWPCDTGGQAQKAHLSKQGERGQFQDYVAQGMFCEQAEDTVR